MLRNTRVLLHGLVVTASVLLGWSADAWAIRYASPTGTSSENCQTPATACDLKTAIEGKAGSEPEEGEEIVVEEGHYTVSTTISTHTFHLHIHGDETGAPPTISGSIQELLSLESATLAYLDIEQTGESEALDAYESTLERVRIAGKPKGRLLCQCYDGLVRDSILVARPGSNTAVIGALSNGGTSTETLRNDTLYSESGEAAAIYLEQQSSTSGAVALTAINTIAFNAAGGHDIVAASKRTTITLNHSYYASAFGPGTITDTGGHMTKAPLLVDPASGDFHEQAGSPTIDAGVTEAEDGTVDFGGGPRVFGASTDIGAYEYEPPKPTPEPEKPTTTSGSGHESPPVPVAPSITGARLSPTAFRAASRGASFAGVHIGATLGYRDDQAATTTIAIRRLETGHVVSGVCRAGRAHGHQKACRRWHVLGSQRHLDQAGAVSLRFSGRLRGKKLPPGRYELTLTPSANSLTGKTVTLAFRIVS